MHESEIYFTTDTETVLVFLQLHHLSTNRTILSSILHHSVKLVVGRQECHSAWQEAKPQAGLILSHNLSFLFSHITDSIQWAKARHAFVDSYLSVSINSVLKLSPLVVQCFT